MFDRYLFFSLLQGVTVKLLNTIKLKFGINGQLNIKTLCFVIQILKQFAIVFMFCQFQFTFTHNLYSLLQHNCCCYLHPILINYKFNMEKFSN